MVKFRLGQKVTIREGFYAPVNGVVTRVEDGLAKSDLSYSFGLEDYIARCSKYQRYDVSYMQRSFIDTVEKRTELTEDKIEAGWHGMKMNGDDDEFIRFGLKEINGRKLEKSK